MLRILKKCLLSLSLVLLISTPIVLTNTVSAAPIDSACEGLKIADPSATCDKAAADTGFGSIIRRVIDILSVVVGAAAVIMIIIGGFRYVLSNGDSNGVQGAKNAILYALVGLIVVLFAQVIVRFVLSTAKSAPASKKTTSVIRVV